MSNIDLKKWQSERVADFGRKRPDAVFTSMPSTLDIIDVIIDLNKAIDDESWKTLAGSHSKDQADRIDHTYHIVNSSIPKEYDKISNPTTPSTKNLSEDFNGIANKTIHKVDGSHIMTKPYFAKNGNLRLNTTPSPGWSTMTTKNLYNAGGIKHLIEDVHTGEITKNNQTIPVTIHKFAKDYDTMGGNNYSKINPTHAHQILTMDYLTDNEDRHSENLLHGPKDKNTGYNPLLAIDHEFSLTYPNSISPAEYVKGNNIYKHLNSDPNSNKELADWWNSKSKDIYEEMGRNLESIKHEDLRKKIRNGFQSRFDIINDWAKKYKEGKSDLFGQNQKPQKKSNIDINEVIKKLPEDKIKAMESLIDYYKGAENKTDLVDNVSDVADNVVKKMTPEETVKFFSRHEPDKNVKQLKTSLLSNLADDPDRFKDHIKELLRVNGNLPEDSQFLNKFWQRHLANSIKGAA